MGRQVLGHRLAVLTVAGHADVEAFQAQVQHDRHSWGDWVAAQVPHQLRGSLGDEGALLAEALGVGDAVVAVVRGASGRGTCRHGPSSRTCRRPRWHRPRPPPWPSIYLVVEWVTISAPHSKGRQLTGVAKVLSTIRGTPWRWAAAAKLLNVQHRQGRVGDGLAEHGLGVGPEGGVQLLLGGSRARQR